MRGLQLLIVCLSAWLWAAPSPPTVPLIAGSWQPASEPMRQLYPDTWFFGEPLQEPSWRDVQFEPVQLECGVC